MTFEGEAQLIINEPFFVEDSSKRPSREQRDWVVKRDGGVFTPVLNDQGSLVDIIQEPFERAYVHHIHPIVHIRDFWANVDPNSPFNMISLSKDFHNNIHTEWVKPLKRQYQALPRSYRSRYSEQAFIQSKTYSGEWAWWLNQYDEVLTAMAITNTYYALQRFGDFPFNQMYKPLVVSLFENLDRNWVDSYNYLKRKPRGSGKTIR